MRKSVIKDDIGYDPKVNKYSVLLNGERLDHCFTADDEEGKAWVYQTDENDDYLLNETKTAILKKVVTGNVEIVCEGKW